ncbi:hypothetical protein Voc01_081800 [Virgisporangium ochraceum]|uniref:Uncharacterized protein n=2 Tax=Virgisporangium ochraceum TaxID=65505 RepID=A0A8J4A1V6_9ACTN|nr:hypothetical protein Voc01_081800 [Virgisporangium ochraceum]
MILTGSVVVALAAVVGVLSALLTDRVRAARDRARGPDRELRARRLDAYAPLYRRVGALSRYRVTASPRAALPTWSDGLHAWYFDEAAGLLLSDDAHRRFLDLLDVLADTAADDTHGPRLVEAEADRLWRAGEALLRRLAADVSGGRAGDAGAGGRGVAAPQPPLLPEPPRPPAARGPGEPVLPVTPPRPPRPREESRPALALQVRDIT